MLHATISTLFSFWVLWRIMNVHAKYRGTMVHRFHSFYQGIDRVVSGPVSLLIKWYNYNFSIFLKISWISENYSLVYSPSCSTINMAQLKKTSQVLVSSTEVIGIKTNSMKEGFGIGEWRWALFPQSRVLLITTKKAQNNMLPRETVTLCLKGQWLSHLSCLY